tara:strand:+ start:125 stop:1309 length:1185 start_codon:yes stop_codon:yes gene_type:complete
MDNSPVFENFMNKMSAMSGRPKINRNTFKIGSPSIVRRVANNERKITVLKNIIRSRNINIGERLNPRVSNVQETLVETNMILVDIASALEQDFKSREADQKLLLKRRRGDKLLTRRENLEEVIESKKTKKVVTDVASKTVKPMKSIFGGLKTFLLLFTGGVLLNSLVSFMKLNPGVITEKLRQVYETIKKHMGLIVAVGAGLVALSLAGTIANIVVVGAKLIAILTNPVVLAGLGILISFAALSKIGKEVFDAKVETAEKSVEQLKKDGLDQGTAEILTDLASPRDLNDKRVLEGYGFPTTTNIPGDIGGNSFLPFMINQNLNKQKNLKLDDVDDTTTIISELPPIDMREEKRERSLDPGGGATSVSRVVSHNVNNNYMKEVPSLFGFGDLVYT